MNRSSKSHAASATRNPRIRIAVVTGSRAEFGLLRPVMKAVEADRRLELLTVVAGSHLLPPSRTLRDVRREFPVHAVVPMQRHGSEPKRLTDAEAIGRGTDGFAKTFERLKPDWVVVLGDRVEAFAAAVAASVGGIALAHIHGGDRAEGIADEAMRHAITKLAHLHLAATERSARRIVRMGERSKQVHVVGSPAIDGLAALKPLSQREFSRLGRPQAVLLLHPCGLPAGVESLVADSVAESLRKEYGTAVLALEPNHDPGRKTILDRIRSQAKGWKQLDHLPREMFVSLLLRMVAEGRSILVGNSSAGLIEAAALRLPVVNVGPRQSGRERGGNVVDVAVPEVPKNGNQMIRRLIAAYRKAESLRPPAQHPYGVGISGQTIAKLLATTDSKALGLLRKHNTY